MLGGGREFLFDSNIGLEVNLLCPQVPRSLIAA
jgi:hypothetical protein